MESDQGDPPEPPPSRGTALTFSDVTEYTITESEYTFASRTQTRCVKDTDMRGTRVSQLYRIRLCCGRKLLFATAALVSAFVETGTGFRCG